jgi:phospho-2-dehydro-3-deoxyheptonate aldolase
VAAACDTLLQAAGLREQVMIDVSHGNSSKQYQSADRGGARCREPRSPPASDASPA